MDQNTDIKAAMPALRRAFDGLKEQLRDGASSTATAKVFGISQMFGEELKQILMREGRDMLQRRDPLTRFFTLRLRGMEQVPVMEGMPGEYAFLFAFTIFPYVEPIMDETTIGDHIGFDETGAWLVQRRMADEDAGTLRAFENKGQWQFDLMPIYMSKAMSLADYVRREFNDDFDAFFARYLADHDVELDMERAWQPLQN